MLNEFFTFVPHFYFFGEEIFKIFQLSNLGTTDYFPMRYFLAYL